MMPDVIEVLSAIKGDVSLLHTIARSMPQTVRGELHALGDDIWAQAKTIEDRIVDELRSVRRKSA